MPKRKAKKWTMPKWMERYRPVLCYGDRAEEFQNCDGKNCNVVVNAPRALFCQSTTSQISLLERLKKAGLLSKATV